ncbi:MAG: hypothetical protein HOW97_11465 [Catenulispora sp.]|nr:hypothetical protein [Catenulispora sp.]
MTPSTIDFVHEPGDPWTVTQTLPLGTVVRVELRPAGGYRWSGIEASEPGVLLVEGTVDDDGAAHFTITTVRTGQVVLAATTRFQGDRFGPPTRRWTMTVLVTPGVNRGT